MTQHEIGHEVGVSQMQVSRISRRALGKLLTAVRGEQAEDLINAAAWAVSSVATSRPRHRRRGARPGSIPEYRLAPQSAAQLDEG